MFRLSKLTIGTVGMLIRLRMVLGWIHFGAGVHGDQIGWYLADSPFLQF